MNHGRDVLWVLCDRAQSNLDRMFYLCYNTKQMMQFGHFKRQKGIASSRSHELLFLCYKGRLPKHVAKTTVHVDGGSPVFNEVVRNVPVLPQKSHAWVSREVRETSLKAMVGVTVNEAEAKGCSGFTACKCDGTADAKA